MILDTDKVSNKEEFILFLSELERDYDLNNMQWENGSIPTYLDAIKSWIEDFSVCPINDIDWEKIDYKVLARIFCAGKYYE